MSEILKMYIKYSVNTVQEQVSIYIPFSLCLGVISELYKWKDKLFKIIAT